MVKNDETIGRTREKSPLRKEVATIVFLGANPIKIFSQRDL
jgi:hypothetical protein